MLCSFDDFANGDCAVRDIPQHVDFLGMEENESLGDVTKE